MKTHMMLIICALGLACGTARAPRKGPPVEGVEQRLAEARRRAAAAPDDAQAQARAGWLEYLLASNPEAARLRFETVLAAAAAAPESRALALAGRAEILEDRLQMLAAARDHAEIVRIAPGSPLAELAAERLLEAEGDSRDLDQVILEVAAGLHAGTQTRAAQLIREAAAHVALSRDWSGAAPDEREAWRAEGAVQHWRVAGPFAAERLLDLDRPTALDSEESAPAPATGPAGSTAERALDFPDGDVGLELEPGEGDVSTPRASWLAAAAATTC